jgi:hypothetical protein
MTYTNEKGEKVVRSIYYACNGEPVVGEEIKIKGDNQAEAFSSSAENTEDVESARVKPNAINP